MADKPIKKTMLELVKVTKVYSPDVVALEDISFSLARGDMIFLTGMSGAGKTTLLKLICGIEMPNQGLIEVDGKDLSRIKPKEIPYLRQKIGMAYQDFKLLEDRTVAQNIAMAMEVSYKNHRTIKDRVKDLLLRLKLEHKHDTLAAKISRGEQQRVAIARAVANSPQLILADEPTGNLDSTTTRLVMDLLADCNNQGATVVLATHDEGIFRNSGHNILELVYGRLSSQPANDKTAYQEAT